MSQRLSPLQANYSVPRDFIDMAKRWQADAIDKLLTYVWRGFDKLLEEEHFDLSKADVNLERGISQQVCQRIPEVMGTKPPYYLEHHPFEDETQHSAKASPPAPDIAFIWRKNPRATFPFEAKILKTDGTVSEYVKDLNDNFLQCRYAPFSSEGGMLGYLMFGKPSNALANIGRSLKSILHHHPRITSYAHAVSLHKRTSESCNRSPTDFTCHHMIVPMASARHSELKSEGLSNKTKPKGS